MTLLFAFQIDATTTYLLTAEEAVLAIEKTNDGGMKLKLSKAIWGFSGFGTGGEPGNYLFWYSAKRYRGWFASEYEDKTESFPAIRSNGEIVKYAWEDNYWYVDPQDGTPGTLLWDGGVEEKPDMERNYMDMGFATPFLNPCCTYSAILAALFVIPGWFLRKRAFGRGLMHTGAFFASFAAAILLTTNGRFMMTHDVAVAWIMSILLMTTMFFSTYLCGMKLWRVCTMSIRKEVVS